MFKKIVDWLLGRSNGHRQVTAEFRAFAHSNAHRVLRDMAEIANGDPPFESYEQLLIRYAQMTGRSPFEHIY